MQYLSFKLGDDFYVIPTADIVTVLPQLRLTEIPQAPDYITGLFRYRGVVHLVIDLSLLTRGEASKRLASTRIVLVNCTLLDGKEVVLGLLLESAFNTLMLADDGWQDNPLKATPGQVVTSIHRDGDEPYQRVTPEQLLTANVLEILHANQ